MKQKDDRMESPRAQAMDWLLRLEARPNDKALRTELDDWLQRHEANASAFRDMTQVWSSLDRLATIEGKPKTPAVAPTVQMNQPRRSRFLRYSAGVALAAAAACVAIVGLPVLQMHLAADAVTGVAERRNLTLDDGSIAMLDARSAISVNYSEGAREIVLLSGNAFFRVVPKADQPFVVRAGSVAVTVVGTAFSVGSSSGQVSVAVESGTVRVASRQDAVPAVLTAGEGLTVDRASGREARLAVLPQDVGAWREDRLVVHDVPLSAVVEELGRYHGGLIVFQDSGMAGELVTGVFDLSRPLEALSAAVDSQGGRVRSMTPYLLVVADR